MIQSIVTKLSKPNRIVDPYLQKTVINIDATLRVAHSFTARPTRNAVESKEDVSDHVTLEPIQLEITGVVSENPLYPGVAIVNSALTAIPNPTARLAALSQAAIGGLVASKLTRRSQTAFDYFEKLWKDRNPFTFITKYKSYKNMVITNFNPGEDNKTGQSLSFSLSMQQVVIATGTAIDIADTQDNIAGASSATTKTGKQTASDASASTQASAERKSSFLLIGAQKVGLTQ